ncbi:MAG: hypothetical protein GX556_01340 [Fibrobacter sp.]|nr:hypothetical protein [Fibrobacter sp.]
MRKVFAFFALAVILGSYTVQADPWAEEDFVYASIGSQSDISTVNASYSGELYAMSHRDKHNRPGNCNGGNGSNGSNGGNTNGVSVPEPSLVLFMVTGLAGLFMAVTHLRKKK